MTRARIAEMSSAVAGIEPGSLVALGGEPNERRPMMLARGLARTGITDLILTGWAPGPDVDLLVEAGATTRVSIPRWIGKGSETIDEDAGWMRFLAASMNIAFIPGPADGKAATALHPDVLLLHADAATPSGVVLSRQGRTAFERDRALATAAGVVIVSVEQIVSELTAERHRDRILVRGDRVRDVVLAPYGSHPTAMPGHYEADEETITPNIDAVDQWAYLDAIGIGRLIHRSTDRREGTCR